MTRANQKTSSNNNRRDVVAREHRTEHLSNKKKNVFFYCTKIKKTQVTFLLLQYMEKIIASQWESSSKSPPLFLPVFVLAFPLILAPLFSWQSQRFLDVSRRAIERPCLFRCPSSGDFLFSIYRQHRSRSAEHRMHNLECIRCADPFSHKAAPSWQLKTAGLSLRLLEGPFGYVWQTPHFQVTIQFGVIEIGIRNGRLDRFVIIIITSGRSGQFLGTQKRVS